MTDPGTAIAAFAMAVISWYGMLRNGVQLIYLDIKASSSYKSDVEYMVDKLGRQSRQLEQWKRQWMIWDDTPESLLLDFWGKVEYDTIKVKLGKLQLCTKGAKKLRKYTKLTKHSWTAMDSLKQLALKQKFLWIRGKYLENLLENMATILKELDDVARIGWQRDRRHASADVDFAEVERRGIGHLLVPIAMRTHHYTEILWQSCHFAQETLSTELDLDIFGASLLASRDKYAEAVVKAAAERHATLTILTRDATLRMAEMTRVCVKESTASSQDNVTALVDALSRVINGSEGCLFVPRSDLAFSVYKSRRHYYDPGTGIRESFREIQSRNRPPSFKDGNLLGSISKFRIAFELAQACFLFLRTSWFSEICTCGIRCGKPPDVCDELRYDFTLQLGKIKHQPARWADTDVPECWGTADHSWNVLTKPLRRLALLLVEVTLGTTVLTTRCDVSGGAIISITFVEGEPGNLRRKTHLLDDVLKKVHGEAHRSDSYTMAVSHCATALLPDTPDDRQMRELLAKFYWDVIVPIKNLYDKRLDRYVQRRREILAAQGE